MPARDPHAGWQADMQTLLDVYDRAPVIAAEDPHLKPIEGGLMTLSYFGANAKPRVLDQRVGARAPAAGTDVASACVAPAAASVEAAQSVLAMTGLPVFAPVWIPVSRHGGEAPESARCDERGRLIGAQAERFFCAFGRLALQPHERRPLVFVSLARRPRWAVSVGATAVAARFMHFVFGDRVNRLMQRAMKTSFEHAPSAPVSDGTLFETSSAHTGASGGWR